MNSLATTPARGRMPTLLPVLAALLVGAGFHAPAAAWASANRYGGHAEGDDAGVSHTNAWGGSTTHAYDGGTTHTSADGVTTRGAVGYGAVRTGPDGNSVYRPPAAGVYHDTGYDSGGVAVYHPAAAPAVYGQAAYAPYRPPAVIAAYTPGCVNCASISSGASVAVVRTGGAVIARYPMGASFATVPSGATLVERNGVQYYQAGDAWFRPYYVGGGVQYTVVTAP